MKKKYVKPTIIGERFIPNEYCVSCSDTEGGAKYKFVCDAGDGVYGGLYDENWNLKSNSYNSYHACDDTHESSTTDLYYLGYFDPDRNHTNGNELKVYIWEHPEYIPFYGWVTNRHATTNIHKETWEKNHS